MAPTLQSELEARRSVSSPGYLQEISRAAETLRASANGFGRSLGTLAPDFALTTPDGESVRLSALVRRGPVVLSFFRGEWCPFCRAELEALQRAQPEMASRSATLVLLSPERPSDALAAATAELGDRTYALQDPMLGIALQYSLVYRVPECLRAFYARHNPRLAAALDAHSWLLPIPADIVVSSDRRIVLSFVDHDFTRRLEPALIIETLDALAGRSPS